MACPRPSRSERCRWLAPSLAALFALATALMPSPALADDAYFYRQGDDYAASTARPEARLRACSFREPVCVHARDESQSVAALDSLIALERAHSTLVRALRLPAPLSDGSLGGDPRFDLYLMPPGELPSSVSTRRDEPRIGEPDRASAFALLDAGVDGCVRDNLIGRAVASAIGYGIDAAEADILRESRAAYLAEAISPCDDVTRPLVDDFQRHPERGIFARPETPASALLFPWYLDSALGRGAVGTLPFALTATSRQRTPLGSFTWVDEPDLFDALRASLPRRHPPQKLSDIFLDFAVSRAFVGDRDDGMHMSETRWLGRSGRVRFDWSVPFASLPRSLAPAAPLLPTGASYLYVDLTGAPTGARVTFRAEWEAPVLFRWAIVRIRRDGTEASRVVVTGQDGATSAMQTIESIDDLAGLVIVGTNTGDVGLARPFDPDEQPAEPHGYVVTIWGE